MTKKYKLRCFWCGDLIPNKNEVYRKPDNEPLCKACMCEYIEEYWDYDATEIILEELSKFNKHYGKWHKDFLSKSVLCSGKHEEYDNMYYILKEQSIEIDGKPYCDYCIDKLEDENHE